MENSKISKKTYQKHKTENKVAIEYKLNMRLKPMEGIFFPLYIEVRFRGKMNFFPSRVALRLSESLFKDFYKNPIISPFFDIERYTIFNSINSFFYNEKDDTTLTKWYAHYQDYLKEQNLITYIDCMVQNELQKLRLSRDKESLKSIEIGEILNNFQFNNHYENRQADLIDVLLFFGVKDVEYLSELYNLSYEVISSISSIVPRNEMFTGDLSDFLTINDIVKDEYKHALEKIKENIDEKGESLSIDIDNLIGVVSQFKEKIMKI